MRCEACSAGQVSTPPLSSACVGTSNRGADDCKARRSHISRHNHLNVFCCRLIGRKAQSSTYSASSPFGIWRRCAASEPWRGRHTCGSARRSLRTSRPPPMMHRSPWRRENGCHALYCAANLNGLAMLVIDLTGKTPHRRLPPRGHERCCELAARRKPDAALRGPRCVPGQGHDQPNECCLHGPTPPAPRR